MKQKQFPVILKEGEKKEIKAVADSKGLSLSSFMRMTALSEARKFTNKSLEVIEK